MLDIGWTELVVIAIVLIVVVGPKDLPPMLRAFGRMTTKLRGMASDFRQQFDEALREADLDDVKKTIDDARRLNPANAIREAINPLRQAGQDIRSDIQKATRTDVPAAAVTPLADTAPATTEAIASGLGLPEVPVGEVLQSDPLPVSTPSSATAAVAGAGPFVKGEPARADTVAAAARASAENQLKRLEVAEVRAAETENRAADAENIDEAGAAKPRTRKKASASQAPAESDAIAVVKPVAKPSGMRPRPVKTASESEPVPQVTERDAIVEAVDVAAGEAPVAKKPRAPRKMKTTGEQA